MINLAKNNNFTSSLIRNSLVQLFWWVIFFPGFFSADSFAAVNMARSGELTNSYTASWALFVRIFSFHGNAIWLLTLINSMILVYSLTAFSYSVFKQSTAAISSFLLTLTPLVWAMGITLWHDILMTSGLLLIVTFFNNIIKGNVYSKNQLLLQLIFGSVLTSFRPNGFPTILLFIILMFVYRRSKKILKYGVICLLASGLVTISTSLVFLGLSPINSYFAQEWMRNDISCFASTPQGLGFVEKNIPKIGTTETWQSSAACTFLNKFNLSDSEKIASKSYVPNAWLELALTEPIFVISTHAKRNAYLLPFPLNGIPRVPFLHSTIEIKNQGIGWAFEDLASSARNIVRAWNGLRGVFAWSGLWLLVLLLLNFKIKKSNLASSIAMTISSISLLYIVAPIPDSRYTLNILITGQVVSIGYLIEFLRRKSVTND